MKATLLPEQTMPSNVGELSLWRNQPRPPYGVRDEVFIKMPCGHTCAMIPEHHQVDLYSLTASPSLVCPVGSCFHGFLQNGILT